MIPLDRWFAAHEDALGRDLGVVLDIESGLREVLLQSRHVALTDGLASVLDVEAGLSAVLPAPAPARLPAQPPPVPEADPGNWLGSVNPQDRMTIRSRPEIAAGTRAHALAARLAAEAAARVPEVAVDNAELVLCVMDFALALTDQLGPPVELTALRARFLEGDRSLGQCAAVRRMLRRARAALAVTGEFGDKDRWLPSVTALIGIVQALLHSARLGIPVPLSVVHILGRVRGDEAWRRFQLPRIANRESHMIALLDDFTEADLSAADLRGIDLTAVRWSDPGTRWPPGFDLADLRSRSDESPVGSGTYVVRGDTTTVPTTVDG